MNDNGARVLVTGAASGLGLELVRRYAARADRVLATDRAAQPPAGVLPDGVDYRPLEVTSDSDWAAARDYVTDAWGGLDLLVNNAGIAVGGRIDRAGTDQWERGIAVNLLGPARGCLTFAPMLKAQRSGRIVIVASLAGLVHGAGMAPYNAGKAGAVALAETLHFELAPFGVGVTCVCPSFFRTALADSMSADDPAAEQTTRRLIDTSALTAEQIADAVVAGVDAGQFLVLPDEPARQLYAAKHHAPDRYQADFAAGAERLAYKELRGEE